MFRAVLSGCACVSTLCFGLACVLHLCFELGFCFRHGFRCVVSTFGLLDFGGNGGGGESYQRGFDF